MLFYAHFLLLSLTQFLPRPSVSLSLCIPLNSILFLPVNSLMTHIHFWYIISTTLYTNILTTRQKWIKVEQKHAETHHHTCTNIFRSFAKHFHSSVMFWKCLPKYIRGISPRMPLCHFSRFNWIKLSRCLKIGLNSNAVIIYYLSQNSFRFCEPVPFRF